MASECVDVIYEKSFITNLVIVLNISSSDSYHLYSSKCPSSFPYTCTTSIISLPRALIGGNYTNTEYCMHIIVVMMSCS